MAKQELSAAAKQWAKDKTELHKHRSAFWDFVAVVVRIRDSQSYLAEYQNFEVFMAEECGWAKSTGYQFIEACQTRQTLSAVADPEKLPVAESHLRVLAKVPPKKQAEVFAAVSELCEAEGREATAKDYKKEAAKFVVEPEPIPEPEPTEPAAAEESPKDLVPKIYSAASRIDAMMKELKGLANEIGGEWLDMTNITTQAGELKHLIRSGAYWRDCPCGNFCKDCRKLGWQSAARKKFAS